MAKKKPYEKIETPLLDKALDQKEYDMINPPHYKNYTVEVIEMMVGIFGKENVANYCEITAFKYRQRMGTKPDNPVRQDLAKEKWYLDKAKQLRS